MADDKNTKSIIGIREKLIAIFLTVKVIPLIILAVIAWWALVNLGEVSQNTAVTDTKNALTTLAVESIERITTDTAQKVAEFLYQRDSEIAFLADGCAYYDFNDSEDLEQISNRLFYTFGEGQNRLIRKPGDWQVSDDGMSWKQNNPYIPPDETKKRSVNAENDDSVNGASFNYRPPYGFNDSRDNFDNVPIYDEIALIDKNGKQIAKYLPKGSTKRRFPFPKELVDVSDPKNTFVKAEHYFSELAKLGKEGIYVSDVIGAYVPSRFVGMYTPDYMASRLIDAKIAELNKDSSRNSEIAFSDNTEIIWQLQILNACLKNEGERFSSKYSPPEIRSEIDRRLGKGKIWPIKEKTLQEVSDELHTLGFSDLAEKILNISFTPEQEAYAGAENPLGVRFEGIVRWAKPVLDNQGEIKGYVTFALNHDHLLEMISHITPMSERYSELSNAFDGNYAFIWDYKCRSIVHPRHHSICGYNPETGLPETPWLEKTLYDEMIAAGYNKADWHKYIATLTDYIPWTGDKNSLAYQSRHKIPAPELTKQGLVGLDGRYLNNAPQCTGWVDLVKDGGSGSLYIYWSGVYKLNTAAAIPYYTGQYSPEVRGNRLGFGFVAVGAGIDDFAKPADAMGDKLAEMVDQNINITTMHLIWTTLVLSIIVIIIAIWMASFLANKLQWLIDGIKTFRRGNRDFRFDTKIRDEFGRLARSFDEMAEGIVRSVHSPMVITDLNHNIVYCNQYSLDVMGKQLHEVVGKSYRAQSIYPFGTEFCPVTALHKGMEQAKEFFNQKTNQYLIGMANYFTDENGEKLGYIITSNDVTDLTRAKNEIEVANKHKSLFLARMSHELRTPMNAMIGLNELTQTQMGQRSQWQEVKELSTFLTQLKGSSLHLLNLLNDILEASNLESGEVTLAEKPLNFQAFLDDIINRTETKCREKQLFFSTSFDDFSSANIIVDGVRLRQVLIHLLDNAVRYTEHGKIEFSVQEKERNRGKILLSFAISDTGIGIAKKNIDRIFHPFEQSDVESGAYNTGTGLGLAIVSKVLELFNSQIKVESNLGRGSTFAFDLWVQEEEAGEKSDFGGLKDLFSGRRALVVDDVRINRLVLVNLLHRAGLIADEASDGQEGLDMFKRSQPGEYDIIFMDIQMPVMNGYDSVIAMRALNRADSQTIPIITISANAFPSDIEKSLKSGMNAHYAKPIQKDTLADVLMTHVKPIQ